MWLIREMCWVETLQMTRLGGKNSPDVPEGFFFSYREIKPFNKRAGA